MKEPIVNNMDISNSEGKRSVQDVLIVGAGMAGLYSAYRVGATGLSYKVLEAGGGVGGTWYWNRYPGARCDVESVDYSFSFSNELQNEWEWSERYAAQPELESYFNHVADRFDLRRHIDFNTSVTRMDFDELAGTWTIQTSRGVYESRYVVLATGPLTVAHAPQIEGEEQFEGQVFHSSRWPEGGVNVAGKRVGIIGTGSTGIQIIPLLAAEADHLTVFQRTPNFSVPARNRPLTAEELAEVRATYPERRQMARQSRAGFPPRTPPISANSALQVTAEQREEVYEQMWERGGGLAFRASFADLSTNREANDTAADFIRRKIKEKVADPQVAEKLTPRDHPYAAKRPPVDIDYYETFNRPNVELVDVKKHPITRLTADALETTEGTYPIDVLVFATGFDAATGAASKIDIRGVGGITLKERWSEGPSTYLGMAMNGFPNLLLINGPGSPAAFTNFATHTEFNVEWVTRLIEHHLANGSHMVQPSRQAEAEWMEHLRVEGDKTLYNEANSWYVGANIPGKPRTLMFYVGGFDAWCARCDRDEQNGYQGFETDVDRSLESPSVG